MSYIVDGNGGEAEQTDSAGKRKQVEMGPLPTDWHYLSLWKRNQPSHSSTQLVLGDGAGGQVQ